MRKAAITLAASLLAASSFPVSAADGIRVATWNISNYPGDRVTQIGVVAYAQWNEHQMDPDIICLQEMLGRIPTLTLVQALNDAPGSPGDWVAAPIFTNTVSGHHTALVYRTSKLEFVHAELVSQGGGPPQHARNVVRFDMRAKGYDEPGSLLSFFPLHYKAGYTDSDLARKLVESQVVRAHIETLPADRHVILGADLNIRHSTDPAYEEINGVVPNTGVLWDPISQPGTWNNNSVFRNIHTQDPTGAGGMDDRLDQILLSPSLLDKRGFEYDGAFPTPWDLSTAEDPNHSHRAWGNDGSTYNQPMRINGNRMVGAAIAQAIADMAVPNGHIPVYLDLNVPPRLRVVGDHQDLGEISHDQSADALVRIGNDGDTQLWGQSGVADLRYEFVSSDGVTVPQGEFSARAGTQLTPHELTIDAAAFPEPGAYEARVQVNTDDPGAPQGEIVLSFRIIGCSQADLAAPLGTLNFFDVSAFLDAFGAQDPAADFNADGRYNFFDVSDFLTQINQGCP